MSESEAYLDITPDVHFLQSVRADRGAWWALAAEGIDNALDANATEVALTLSRHAVQLQDNGVGISRDRETAIVRLGEHRPMLSTSLGRFGIGIKYNAMSAGDRLEVLSISRDGRLELAVDWTAMLRGGRWRIPRPIWAPALRHAQTGTTITIKALRWPGPTPSDIEKARDELAQRFHPALAAGRTITLNGLAVPCLREPEMEDVIDAPVRLPSGKGAHIRAGILTAPERSSLYMVHVSYKHRVIDAKSTFGTAGYSGLRRMFARVTLTGDWGLRRFKDGLEDPEADVLEDQVRDALQPILERCNSAQMSVTVEEMAAMLNDMLPPEVAAVRPPKKKEGEAEPERHRRKRKPHGLSESGVEHPRGPARMKRSPTSMLIIDFDGPLADEVGYGRFVPGRPGKIILAKDNPDIAEWLQHRDRQVAARALYAIALMLYEHARETDPGQKELPFDGPFGLRVWKLAQRQKVEATP